MIFCAARNMIELSNGKDMVATNTAIVGFGLNWKFSPFENGRENIYAYHVAVNHNAANAGIIENLTIVSLG